MLRRHLVFTSALALCAAAILPGVAGSATAAPATPSALPLTGIATTLSHTVPSLEQAANDLGALDPARTLHLILPLTLPDQSALDQLVNAEYTPGSATFHRFLDPATFGAEYGAPASEVDSVVSSLHSLGFSVATPSVNHLYVKATAPVSVAETAFGVSIRNFSLPHGISFFANTGNITLPAQLAGAVTGVIGLDDSAQPESQLEQASTAATPSAAATRHSSSAGAPAAAGAGPVAKDGGASPCGAAVAGGGYTAPQLASAYNFNGLYAKGFLGQKMSAALVEFDDYHDSNVKTVENCYGLHAKVKRVVVDGGTGGQPHEGEVEDMADISTLLEMLPKLAHLDVYVAPITNLGEVDLYNRYAVDDKAPVLSSSWGNCEEINSEADNRLFGDITEEAAAQGQQILTAAGDSGAVDCRGYPAPTGGSISVEQEAAVPWVTGVGGTDLGQNTANGISPNRDEDTWNDGGAGGGGVSTGWAMPSWQHALKSARTAPGHSGKLCGAAKHQLCREVPDISANADPLLGMQSKTKYQFTKQGDVGSAGYSIYCGTPNCLITSEVGLPGLPITPPGGVAGWQPVGGTSLSTPLTAAAVVLWDQEAKAKHLRDVGLINPALYRIASHHKKYAKDFYDITTDSNDDQYDPSDCPAGCNPSHLYKARKGYDMATGLGSYNAAKLGADVVADAGHLDVSPSRVTVYGYTHGHATTSPVVLSSGVKKLHYHAKSSAKWLHVKSGKSTGALSWSAHPKGLHTGSRTGTITVRAHGHKAKLSVHYEVSKPAKLHLSTKKLHFSERAVNDKNQSTTATCGDTLWNDELYDAVNDSKNTPVDASTKQSLGISNKGPKGSSLHWQAFYRSDTGGWLNVDLTGGALQTAPSAPLVPTGGTLKHHQATTLPMVSIANVNALGGYPRMNQGTYHGVIKVYDLADPAVVKKVKATVKLGTGKKTPTVHTKHKSLHVTVAEGKTATVTVSLNDASKSCGYDYSVSSNHNWATPNKDDYSGTVAPTGSGSAGGSDTGSGTGTIPVVVSAKNLKVGKHHATLTVQSENAEPNPLHIHLHVHVTH
jgi:hypothetical protein